MKLTTEEFRTEKDLCDYINENRIKSKHIQQILYKNVPCEYGIVLFFWE